MKRYTSLAAATLLVLAACSQQPDRDLAEYDVAALQQLMQSGELTAGELVAYYQRRIEAFDRHGPALRAIIELNPDALAIAQALDRERQVSGPRGPLHGIPVLLKANIDTGDRMATTAGSLALAGHIARDDAFHVAGLRAAGAVILGKTNLSEWANFRSIHASSGWSSIGGQTRNPYQPLRSPCGSSSGSAVAVAANLATLAIGTETNGSVVCPAASNGIVGIKPTLGLVSRDGIIPIAHTQDTAGPMARTVRDAALLLNAMVARDDADPASAGRPAVLPDYAAGLDAGALSGKRIGVLRSYSGAGQDARIEQILTDSIETLRAHGAIIVDPVAIDASDLADSRFTVLLYEFKADLNKYLRDADSGINDLAGLIAFNAANADQVMPHFQQEIFERAQEKGPLTEDAYLAALQRIRSTYRQGLDDALQGQQLDALLAPSNGPAWMIDHVNGDSGAISSSSFAAVSGYANVTVPAGFVAGLPIGVSFIGGAYSDKLLIDIAYAFEQASQVRRPPPPL
ncbi:MAG: amidase [Gammaproteobacteria bacterium]|nr:MAG: amidase [Gammaproteobacteria bacterium]